MPLRITSPTDLRLTLPTNTLFLAFHLFGVVRTNPFSTLLGWAVNTVLGGVFFVLAVPFLLPFVGEDLVDYVEGNLVCGTAFWRHLLRVFD